MNRWNRRRRELNFLSLFYSFEINSGSTVSIPGPFLVKFEWAFNATTSPQEWKTVKGENDIGVYKGNNKIRSYAKHLPEVKTQVSNHRSF